MAEGDPEVIKNKTVVPEGFSDPNLSEDPVTGPRSQLHADFEGQGITPEMAKEMYDKLALEFSPDNPLVFTTFDAEKLKVEVKKRAFLVMAKKDKFWDSENIAEFIKDKVRQGNLADAFADEVVVLFKNQIDAPGGVSEQIKALKTLGKDSEYVSTLQYENNLVVANVEVREKAKDAPKTSGEVEYTTEEKKAFKTSLKSGKGKILIFLFQMFGVIDMKKLAKEAGDDKVKLGNLMDAELDNIIGGGNLAGNFLCGLFGYEFGKKTLEDVASMHPKAEEVVEKLKNNKWIEKMKLGAEGVTTEEWGPFVFGSLAGAKPLTEKLGLAKSLVTDPGNKLLIEVPSGKSVTFKRPEAGNLKLFDAVGKEVAFGDGPITASGGVLQLFVSANSVVGAGSTFDKGVKLAWEEVEDKTAI